MAVARAEIERAAALLRGGRQVAFPTETVYGLGASALDPEAVARIFAVKGRPATSPLIVHASTAAMARSLTREWPNAAARLAVEFWPGPLTLVLPKVASIPAIVTAGLDTAGVRVPAHPVALELIEAAGVPVAAPSANRFTELSPTRAEHVRQSLGSAVDMILDGGSTTVGIESTVLSLAGGQARLLRPGMISRADIESVIGPVELAHRIEENGESHPSPGMHHRHYSPRTPMIAGSPPPAGRCAYLWITRELSAARAVPMPSKPAAYAAMLYAVLHELDAEGYDAIVFEPPPSGADWAAIRDRLERASAQS